MPSLLSAAVALIPSRVNGHFTTMFLWILASLRPSAIIASASVEITSALMSPSTMSQIMRTCSSIGRPSLAISDGLVVTPSTIPQLAPFFSSSRFAVSKKNFMSCPPSFHFSLHRAGESRFRAKSAKDAKRTLNVLQLRRRSVEWRGCDIWFLVFFAPFAFLARNSLLVQWNYSAWENLLHRNIRLPDECSRLRKGGGHSAVRRLCAGRNAGRRGAGPLQHVQHPRQGRTEGLQPPAELQARGDEGQDFRRVGLRRPAGRGEDLRPRAARFAGCRLGQLYPPRRNAGATRKRQPPRHRTELRQRRSLRHAVYAPRQPAPRLPHHHRRLRQILRLLRGALHPRTGAQPHQRERHGGSVRARRKGLHRSPVARPERQQLPRSLDRKSVV